MDGIQPPEVESSEDRIHVVYDTSATGPAQHGPRDIRWICHTAIIDGPRSRRHAGLQTFVWTSHQPTSQLMLPTDKELCSRPDDGHQKSSSQQFRHLQSRLL